MRTNSFIKILACIFYLISNVYCKNFYEILGVQKTDTTAQIKKAFRNLAMKYHPDKNKEADAEKKFREIVEAYEVLSDPDKRQAYDQSGQTTFNQNNQQSGDFNFNDFFKNFDEAFRNHRQNHDRTHKKAHEEAMKNARKRHEGMFGGFSFDFDDLFDDNMFGGSLFGEHDHDSSFGDLDSAFSHASFKQETRKQGGQTCRTITKRTGNSVMTQTICQ